MGLSYSSNSKLIAYSTEHLEIGRLASEQKSEFTGTRHGVTDSERDDATTGTSRITMTKIKSNIRRLKQIERSRDF